MKLLKLHRNIDNQMFPAWFPALLQVCLWKKYGDYLSNVKIEQIYPGDNEWELDFSHDTPTYG